MDLVIDARQGYLAIKEERQGFMRLVSLVDSQLVTRLFASIF